MLLKKHLYATFIMVIDRDIEIFTNHSLNFCQESVKQWSEPNCELHDNLAM